jgi:menaquinol-cytochrome c reductase cytochrome b/c subunit
VLRSASICAGTALFALVGCGGASKLKSAASAPAQPGRAETVIAVPTGGPTTLQVPPPPAVLRAGGRQLADFTLGAVVTAQSGCLACHAIGGQGNRGPGPNLTQVGSRLSTPRIERALIQPTEPMPSFKHLPRAKLRALVVFLALLRR